MAESSWTAVDQDLFEEKIAAILFASSLEGGWTFLNDLKSRAPMDSAGADRGRTDPWEAEDPFIFESEVDEDEAAMAFAAAKFWLDLWVAAEEVILSLSIDRNSLTSASSGIAGEREGAANGYVVDGLRKGSDLRWRDTA